MIEIKNIKIIFLLPEVLIFCFIISLVLIWCFILIKNKKLEHYNYTIVFYKILIHTLPIFFIGLCLTMIFIQKSQWDLNQIIVLSNLFVYNEFILFSKLFLYFIFFIISLVFKQYNNKVLFKNISLTFPRIQDYIFIEFLIIFLFLSLFSSLLISCNEVILAYILLEGVSLVSVVLIAHLFNISSAEAAIKYLVYSILSSVFFLGGFFFLWSNQVLCLNLSSFNFDILGTSLYELTRYKLYTLDLGVSMIIISFLIKFGIFPVHFWVVDVYDGTWNFVMFILATAIKVVYFFFFLRLFFNILPHNKEACTFILIMSSIGSLFFSSIVALTQENVKRLLAYTSIGQMGFVFLGLINTGLLGLASSLFHFLTYIISLLLFFIIYFNKELPKFYHISDFSGIGKKNPILSFLLTVSLLSMAGLPPLIGFFSKYYVFIALMANGYYSLTLFAIFISVISSFVYIRLIKIIWFDVKNLNVVLNFHIKSIADYTVMFGSICAYFLLYFIVNPECYLHVLEILCNNIVLIYV